MTAELDVKGLVDKRNIFLLLGCYCNNPKMIFDEKYETNAYDYSETFHKTIWGAIVNIAKKGNIQKISPVEIENEIAQFPSATTVWKNNDGWNYIDKAIAESADKLLNAGFYRDTVRKYSIIRNAVESLKLDISFLYDEDDEVKLDKFNSMTSTDVLNEICCKFSDFKNLWKSAFGDNYSFHAGDDIKNRISEYKNQTNTYGYPFQSGYLTTVYRGMRSKKMIIRSSISGGGKSRSSMADAVNIACDKIYDWQKKEWIATGEKRPVLFISTELTKEEIQDCLLAHISGIEQDRLEEWKDITPEEEKVLDKSAEIVEESLLYGEYQPDFTIDTICETIEQYIINQKIEYVFFDYINDSPSLYAYYFEKTKTRLRTDQILFLFSAALKSACNKYDVFLGTSTQLNDTYKDDINKDSGALKGSKSIIEKADGGMLALPVTAKDLKKLKPILEARGNFNPTVPNMAYWIFKNRGGKWKAIVIWTKINLGTMREMDCFVTDYNYELIDDIEKTIIEFEFDDVGNAEMLDTTVDVDAVKVIDNILNPN